MASSGSCGGRSCRQRVAPAPWDVIKDHMVEVRPDRQLHIQHINPRSRDEQFEKEIQTFLQYSQQGLASNGPMALPKKQVLKINPNVDKSLNAADMQPGVPLENYSLANHSITRLKSREQTPDSVISLAEDRKTLISASGIDVAVSSHKDQVTNKAIHSNGTKLNNSGIKAKAIQNAVLFFIHGVGGSSDVWRAQLNYFGHLGYEIVAPDLIGHGMSCAPKAAKNYHFDQIAADIEGIFDKYCKRNNVVIGHSYGCSFAAVLARSRSKRVTKLIMISGGGPTPLAPQPGVFSLPVSLLACLRPCVECKYKKSAFSGLKPIMRPEEAFAVPTYVLGNTMNGQIWSDGDELFHNWIVSPTLLIYGQKDKLISLKEEEDMNEAIYNSELEIISEASHMVMIEEPDRVNNLIYNFLLRSFRPEGESNMASHELLERRQSSVSIRSLKSGKSIPHL